MNLLEFYNGNTEKLDKMLLRLGKAKLGIGVMIKDKKVVTFIARDRFAKRYTITPIEGILK